MISLERRSSAYTPEAELPPEFLPELTPRQKQVAHYLASGFTNKQIGALLRISEATVRETLRHIRVRLHVNNGQDTRVQIAVHVVREWERLESAA